MKVLVISYTRNLTEKLTALSPNLEYCAIAAGNPKRAKNICDNIGLSEVPVYSLEELPACLGLPYDYILLLKDGWWSNEFKELAKKYSLPRNKILTFCALHGEDNFLLERSLRYFKEHAADFEMFATGISTAEKDLDVPNFKRKLFNFGRGSQDLYYNFQVAKFVVSCAAHNLRYALIGLAPYSFHYDLSQTPANVFILLQHLIAFNDLHNFQVPLEEYRKIFREEYLAKKIPLESINLNDPYAAKKQGSYIKPKGLYVNEDSIDHTWCKRYFPKIMAENAKILDDYLTLCETNNIRPIIFLPPYCESYKASYNRERLNEFYDLVGQACKNHPSALFLDSWKLNLVTDYDFYDKAHLNILGAKKFSSYLSDFVEGLTAISVWMQAVPLPSSRDNFFHVIETRRPI